MFNLGLLNLEDWAKIITVILSAATIYYTHFHKKVKLNAFFITSGALKIPDSNQYIHTHFLVIRNDGKLPATNVTIVHNYFPKECSVNIYPSTESDEKNLDQGKVVKIERIRPSEEITLSYLYPPNITVHQIGHIVKHDGGQVNIWPVKYVKFFSKSFERFVGLLLFVGIITTIWVITKGLVIGINIFNFLHKNQLLN